MFFYHYSSSVFSPSLKTQSAEWQDFYLHWKHTQLHTVTLSIFFYFSCYFYILLFFSPSLPPCQLLLLVLFELHRFYELSFFSPNFTDGCINRLIKILRLFSPFSPGTSDLFKRRLCIFTRLWYWSRNQGLFLDFQKLFTIISFLSTWLKPPVNIFLAMLAKLNRELKTRR